MFNIEISEDEIIAFGEKAYSAKITINDFEEWTTVQVPYWSKSQFLECWKKNIKNGLEEKKWAILPMTMYPRERINFIQTWILYFEGDKVYVQDRWIFEEQFPDLDINNLNKLDVRRDDDDDDDDEYKTSEWECSIDDVKTFYNSIP